MHHQRVTLLLWDCSVSICYYLVSSHILTVIVARYDIYVRAGLSDSGDEAEMEVVVQHPGMRALTSATLNARHAQLMPENIL